MTLSAFRAEIVATPDDPKTGAPVVHFEDGMLVVEEGRVLACGDFADVSARFPDIQVTQFPGKLIAPGFIDAHVHYPQTERIAAFGGQLLEWLDEHIFPAEQAFADRLHGDRVAAFFLEELLRNGTTSALVFATVHAHSVDALFEAALERDMRIISGKVLMDHKAPDGLRDTVETGRSESEALIARWRGRGRLGYAITPRFALTSSDGQLASAGDMLAAHPDVLLHTHLAENVHEVAEVNARFTGAADYLDVYDKFGLVGSRSVFAHCVQLKDDQFSRLCAKHAHVAFCPSSNLFLGSGLLDLDAADRAGVSLGLGTDVGAGTSFSLLHTMGEAYKVCQMRGRTLDPFRALYMATAGGAHALGIADKVGALAVGQEADFVVLDPGSTPLLAQRTLKADLREKLFALQILGDDRAIAATYLRGRLAHQRQH